MWLTTRILPGLWANPGTVYLFLPSFWLAVPCWVPCVAVHRKQPRHPGFILVWKADIWYNADNGRPKEQQPRTLQEMKVVLTVE